MLDTSPTYKELIVADSRRMKLRAVMDIVDPDIVYGAVGGSTQSAYSNPSQLYDGVTDLQPYATLETNRWILDGTFDIAHAGMTQQIAWESNSRSNASTGTISVYFTIAVSGVDVLQGLTVFWPQADYDGIAEDFTVEVRQGGTAYYSKTVTGNADSICVFKDFTVYTPDTISISISKWSMGGRRARCPEVMAGLHEEWSGDDFSVFSVRQQADFSCVSLPYGTASFDIDNSNKTFEPRAKTGLMQSIEERQGVKISIGVEGAEYVPVGTFYQFQNGWKTSTNALVMTWSLVDIVGLLVDRQYSVPDTLPTTLDGWIANIVSQLGDKFLTMYHVDPNYGSVPLTVLDAASLVDKTCGQILLWCCQASGTWPRADATTGKLCVEPFWSQGNSITLDNIERYPTMSANKDIAFVRFTLPDQSTITIQGTSPSSPNTVEINNPFIHDQTAALTAAREIIAVYGGNILTTTGRGDPSSEIGDVPTVQLDKSSATTGRLYYQDFVFSDGVLKGCTTQLLQAAGGGNYATSEVITEGGTWTSPAGVSELKIILVGGGYGGGTGQDGSLNVNGARGADGLGGKVYSEVINVNEGQTFAVTIGQGAAYGTDPTDTTFGAYSSADGVSYTPSYTDVQSGEAYGRTGVADPTGNGDGGRGGAGGNAGSGYAQTTTTTTYILYPDNGEPYEISEYVYNELCNYSPTGNPDDVITGHIEVTRETRTQFIWTTSPTSGQAGVAGAKGCAVVYY